MSVDRDTLARVNGIPTDQVKCANCARHSEFLNDLLWCDGWNASARADEFCSFYARESEGKMDDSKRTVKYYAPNYTVLQTRQCLVCGTLENYSASVVNTGLPWLCGRCRKGLLKLIYDTNTSNALNALEQENKELTDRNVGKWERHDDGIMFWWECSECHQDPWYDREELYDYCPSCGAKMEFGESEEEKDG